MENGNHANAQSADDMILDRICIILTSQSFAVGAEQEWMVKNMRLLSKRKQHEILLRLTALGIILSNCIDVLDQDGRDAFSNAVDHIAYIAEMVGGCGGSLTVIDSIISWISKEEEE